MGGSGSRRLLSTKVKKYEVSYEVIPPSYMDPSVVVDKANRITEASTTETQVFRQVLLKVAAYQFEEELTTPAPSADVGPNKNGASGMSVGLIVLIVLLVFLCLVVVVVVVLLEAEKRYRAPRKAMKQGDLEAGNATVVREPSHTLLDGDVHDAKKSKELRSIGNATDVREPSRALLDGDANDVKKSK